MTWRVLYHDEFSQEYENFPETVQNSITEKAHTLGLLGSQLGRPFVDTLKGSKHANMKELRLTVKGGVWRVAFAFDPERQAILLVAGNKKGKNQRRFYKTLIKIADERFDQHLNEE